MFICFRRLLITYPYTGYTVVFKDGITEEIVQKYMGEVVDADGRITQTYDWFLNVRPPTARNIHVTSADVLRYFPRASALLFLLRISNSYTTPPT